MVGQDDGWARDFFGPLWSWLMIGVGLVLMASAYGLLRIGVSNTTAFVPFGVGVIMIVAAMAYLAVQGRKTWRAWFWPFHLDDTDLLMGRKKED